ncbi:MarR family winged helix-turn-helix transcriptional regulator [Enterobacter asburiae]|nr:MarR family winged helix-turn-helix transcriptional regulator [Enterobacter asburiae]
MWQWMEPRDRNIFGAFALMISDDIVRASSSRAPELAAASALALLAHKPGLSIRMLAIGVGLSHAGTVRLVDRLVSEGLIERREHSTDGRARSLYLTPTGKVASDEVLASRDQVIAEGLSILNPDELKTLSDIAERVLRNRLENLEQSYRICRLCCYEGCTNGTVAKLAMRQPFVLFKGLTFQKLCLPGAFRPGDHHNKMLRPGLCVVHASPQYL